jgi:hypothetical protein
VQATDHDDNDQAAAGTSEEEGAPPRDDARVDSTHPEEVQYQASLEPPDGAPIRVSLQDTPSQNADSEIKIHLNLAEGTRVRVIVEALSDSPESGSPAARMVFEGGRSKTEPPQFLISSGEETDKPIRKPASRLAELRGRWPYSLVHFSV